MAEATKQGRTLVRTTNPGWYLDANNPDGARLRKRDGDTIIDRETYEMAKGNSGKAAAQGDNGGKRATANKGKAAQQKTKAPTGKTLVGETVTIRCAWVDPKDRNDKVQKLFDRYYAGDKAALTYDKVVAAGGKPDGRERVIKTQDAFQVRFHPDNQAKARNERRRLENEKRKRTKKGGRAKATA